MIERNKTMDIFLALGIIFVVMGHDYQPEVFLLPAYTFQIALFFFVSGYFFKTKTKLKEKFTWIINKAKKLLIPYFILNIFFAALTYFLLKKGIILGDKPTLYNFFITPFINGHQYFLYLAAWFVPQLFLIHLVAQLLTFKDNQKNIIILLIPVLLLSAWFVNDYQESNGIFLLVAGRTAFGLTFYLLGKLLNTYENKIKKYLISLEAFVFLYIIYVYLGYLFGAFNYSLIFGTFSNNFLVTTLGSLSAILMIYIISSYISLNISKNSLFIKIGQHTFAIMAGHLLVFFLINCCLYKLLIIPKSSLSYVFFNYQEGITWLLYSGLGILLPLGLILISERIYVKK